MICVTSGHGNHISDWAFYFLILVGIATGALIVYAMKYCMEEAEETHKKFTRMEPVPIVAPANLDAGAFAARDVC